VDEEPLGAVWYELVELVGEKGEKVEYRSETFVGAVVGLKSGMMRFRWLHESLGEAGEVLAF